MKYVNNSVLHSNTRFNKPAEEFFLMLIFFFVKKNLQGYLHFK